MVRKTQCSAKQKNMQVKAFPYSIRAREAEVILVYSQGRVSRV